MGNMKIFSIEVDGTGLTDMTPSNISQPVISSLEIAPDGLNLAFTTCSGPFCTSDDERLGFNVPIDCAPAEAVIAPVPTMGNWSMIILALILMSIGAVVGRNYEATRN